MDTAKNMSGQSVVEPGSAAGNRRRCPRQKPHGPAYVSTRNPGEGVPGLHEIIDVSESGISFRASSPMAIGQRLKLCMDLPEATSSVWAEGRVMWTEESGRTGVRLAKLRGLQLKQLREWVLVNALAVCVNHALLQDAVPNPEWFEDESPADALPPFAHAETAVLPQVEYAVILTRLAAIRREAEASSPDFEMLLRTLGEHASAFTGASGTAIALASGAEMICCASVGSGAPGVGVRFQLDSGFSGQCVRKAAVLRCDDCEIDARVDRENCRALGIRSIIAVPILAADAVIGLLEVFSPQPRAFGVRDRIFLQRLADIIFVAVRRSIRALAAGQLVAGNGRGGHSGPTLETAQSASNPLGFEELNGAEIASGGAFDEIPPISDAWHHFSFPRSRWALVIAVAILLVAVAVAMPWIESRFRHATDVQPTSPAETSAVKVAGVRHDPQAELDRLHKLAEQGDASAQFALGARYAIGDEVGQDYVAAAHWFAQAADQGQVVAQATLGAYYWAGTGVPKDLDKAYFWSVLARAGGDEGSKYRVSALAEQLSRSRIIAAQDAANDWLRQHQSASQRSRR